MELLNLIFLMLITVGIARILANVLPIPLPFLQIILGALIALPSFGVRIEVQPEIFMVLFIPLLIWVEAYSLPKNSFIKDCGPILGMAVGLVVLTVILCGFFIHYLVPMIPLAACFALAAVLAPTDAVAVSALAHGKLPEKIGRKLGYESMLNDGSSLSLFAVAIAALSSGVFSPIDAGFKLVIMAIGGLVVGAAISWLVGKGKSIMTARGFFDPITPVFLMLLVPFAAFIAAEHLHLSGILAAVGAGWVQSRAQMASNNIQTRMLNRSIVHVIVAILEGALFIILGNALPGILEGAVSNQSLNVYSIADLTLYVALITGSIFVIRFVWIYGYKKLAQLINRARGICVKPEQDALISGLMTVAGVRGAITLAAVMSVPVMIGTHVFAGRDMMIFLAMGVILLSLVVGVVGIPFFLRFVAGDEEKSKTKELLLAKVTASASVIRFLEEWEHSHSTGCHTPCEAALMAEVLARVMADYRQDVDALDSAEDVRERAQAMETLERDLRLKAIGVQRKELFKLRRKRMIDDEAMRQLITDLDYSEAALQ
jgi:CPA1 family monovalent cation:H+ antiporter